MSERSQSEKDDEKARRHAKKNGWQVRRVVGYVADGNGYRTFVYIKVAKGFGWMNLPEVRPEDTVRLPAARVKPDGYVDCECCGMPVIGEWKCPGCSRGGRCSFASTWHCSGRYGHRCDGTVCPTNREEMAEWKEEQRQRVLHARTRKPGFVPFR